MQNAKLHMAIGGLQVITLKDRRDQYSKTASILQELAALVSLRKVLITELEKRNYRRALEICTNITTLLAKYPDFTCLKSIDIKPDYSHIKQQLKAELVNCCKFPFDSEKYRNTISAYRKIRNISQLTRQLYKHFQNYINRTILSTIRSSLDAIATTENVKWRSLVDILSEDSFRECFRSLLTFLVKVMVVHYEMGSYRETTFFIELGKHIETQRKTLWQEMEHISIYFIGKLAACDVGVINEVGRFISVGESFTGEKTYRLRKELQSVSKLFFNNFHKSRIEELHEMLENELWVRVPVKPRYSLRDIPEISRYLEYMVPKKSVTLAQMIESNNFSLSSLDIQFEDNEQKFEDDFEMSVSNTAINLFRLIGKYLSLTDILHNVSWQIIQGITQLVNLYIFSTYCFFGPSDMPFNMVLEEHISKKDIKLNDRLKIISVLPRIVATESLLFVYDTCQTLKPYFKRTIPKANMIALNQFYMVMENIDVRCLFYKELISKLLPSYELIKIITVVKWKHKSNAYMYTILNLINERFTCVLRNVIEANRVPKMVQRSIWDTLVLHVYESLMEGYYPGHTDIERDKMMTDFHIFQQMIAKQIPEPFPTQYNTYVETYISAYSVPPSEFHSWLENHFQDYSFKQLTVLVNQGPWDSKTKNICHKILIAKNNAPKEI